MRHDAFVENSRLLSWLRTQLSQTKSMQSAVNTTQVKLAKYTSLKSHFRIRVKQTLNNLVTEPPRFFLLLHPRPFNTSSLHFFASHFTPWSYDAKRLRQVVGLVQNWTWRQGSFYRSFPGKELRCRHVFRRLPRG